MEILIISGLSGSGKSKAASFLEDMGFYIVDNMPAGMILKFAEFCAAGSSRYSRVALVYDVRTADTFDEFLEVLSTLRRKEYDCKLLFLEADVGTIIRRYKETPPPPPPAGAGGDPPGGGGPGDRDDGHRPGSGGCGHQFQQLLHRPA